MSMSVSKKDLLLLLGLCGVLAAALVYFFVYQPFMQKSDALETENNSLSVRIAELEAMEAKREEYITETEDMNRQIASVYNLFPSNVMAEDAIYLAIYEESLAPLQVNGITIEPQEVQYQSGGNEDTEGTEEKEDAIDKAKSDAPADQAALEADAELEGTAVDSDADDEAAEDRITDAGANMVLYNQPVTISYELSYDGLKRCINYICTNPNRMTVESVAAAYDNTSGMLSGNMRVNMYYLTGNGKPYTPPDFSNVLIGNTNLFGSIVLPETQSDSGEDAEEENTDANEQM